MKTTIVKMLPIVLVLAGCAGKAPQSPYDAPIDPTNVANAEEGSGLSPSELETEYRSLAHESYARGVYLRESGDAVGALQAFQEAVRTSPKDSGLRLAFVEQMQEMGQLRQARAFLISAIERFEGSAEEHLLLARLEMWSGRNEPALTEVDRAIELDANLAEARSLQGQLLIALGDVPSALISFQAANALQPNNPVTQARIAECHTNMGNLEDAIAAWQSALDLDPDMHPARAALGSLLLRADRVDEAMALFVDGLQRDPTSLGPLVDTLVQAQRYGEAARILASQREKGLLQAREEYLYARILLYLGREQEAKTLLQSLSDETGLQGIETLLGEIAMRDGRLEDARTHFDLAIKADPNDCSAWVNRAVLSAEQMRDETGRLPRQGEELKQLHAFLAQASKVTGDEEYRCHVLLASVYTALREFEPAVEHLEKGYMIDPENTDVQFNLAMAHQELGHFEAALKYGRGVLQHDPNHAAALNFVGYILAERGLDLEDSESLIRRALHQEPDNGYYVDSLGWVLYQSGNYLDAAEELERAVQLTGENDAVILEHLGDAYVKVERLNDAMRAYGQSQKLEPNNPQLLEKIKQVEVQMAD